MSKKKETIEEFLARGGKVTIIPPEVEDPEEGVIVRPISSRSPTLYSLDEAQHFFGKKKVSKKKAKLFVNDILLKWKGLEHKNKRIAQSEIDNYLNKNNLFDYID